ncbi:MAG TPA: hypothetical protein VFT31_06615 [Kribbella sp.]|nr:hypothetical protein [Kribbella sp.]
MLDGVPGRVLGVVVGLVVGVSVWLGTVVGVGPGMGVDTVTGVDVVGPGVSTEPEGWPGRGGVGVIAGFGLEAGCVWPACGSRGVPTVGPPSSVLTRSTT